MAIEQNASEIFAQISLHLFLIAPTKATNIPNNEKKKVIIKVFSEDVTVVQSAKIPNVNAPIPQ